MFCIVFECFQKEVVVFGIISIFLYVFFYIIGRYLEGISLHLAFDVLSAHLANAADDAFFRLDAAIDDLMALFTLEARGGSRKPDVVLLRVVVGLGVVVVVVVVEVVESSSST